MKGGLLLFSISCLPSFRNTKGNGKENIITKLKGANVKTCSAYVGLSSETKPAYLNCFYQFLISSRTIAALMGKLQTSAVPQLRSAQDMLNRIRHSLQMMSARWKIAVNSVFSLDDIVTENLRLPFRTLGQVPLAHFPETFGRLMILAAKEIIDDSSAVEEILTGQWASPENEVPGVTSPSHNFSPITLTVGKLTCEQALNEHFASRVNGEITKNNRPKIKTAPAFLFMVLNWIPNAEKQILLPFFRLNDYAIAGKTTNYIGYAFFYKKEDSERYIIKVRRFKGWRLFDDERHEETQVSNRMESKIFYKKANWRCEMVVYIRDKNALSKNFDFSQDVYQNRQSNVKKDRENPINVKKRKASHSSQEEAKVDNFQEPSSVNKKIKTPSDNVSRPIKSPELSPAFFEKDKVQIEHMKDEISWRLEENTMEIEHTDKDIFPRIESIELFVEDVFSVYGKNRNQGLAALLAKHRQKSSFSREEDQRENFSDKKNYVINWYNRYAIRLIVMHYASMNVDEKPFLYMKALIWSCDALNTVYPADKRFFSAAYAKLLALKKIFFKSAKSSEERELFQNLFETFMEKAQKMGLIERNLKLQKTLQFTPSNKFLEEILADNLFRNIRTVVECLKRRYLKQESCPEAIIILAKARENYLENTYHT